MAAPHLKVGNGAQTWLAPNPATVGQDLYDYLWAQVNHKDAAQNPDGVITPTFRKLNTAAYPGWCVPISQIQTFGGVTTVKVPYLQELQAQQDKTSDPGSFGQTSVFVEQHSFGIVDTNATRRILYTQSISVCVAVLVYSQAAGVAALAHVDKDNGDGSLTTMLDIFTYPDTNIYLYGGFGNPANASGAESRSTLIRILQNVYTNRNVANFRIVSLDFQTIPHTDFFSFNPTTRNMFTAFAYPNDVPAFPLDSEVRVWPDNTYHVGPATNVMADMGAAIAASLAPPPGTQPRFNAAQIAQLRDLRLQWDGRQAFQADWRARVNRLICKTIVQQAIWETDARDRSDPTTNGLYIMLIAMRNANALEFSLKAHLSSAAARNGSVVTVVKGLLISKPEVQQAGLLTWLNTANNKAPYLPWNYDTL
ncbi:hypothetical protein JAAARDRAFT_210940 [Jaapia argillacea MUCL 33604]|uniref:Uncharacterized protein n=1 Tax=Jaapia argillacea MUCL 33604 TaxID=933084 RepID=A0A067P9M2_9AGAM|nr:hypothetical protein JAAARDRAFT_210940 [Jaapia argillacea MUCL 33604]